MHRLVIRHELIERSNRFTFFFFHFYYNINYQQNLNIRAGSAFDLLELLVAQTVDYEFVSVRSHGSHQPYYYMIELCGGEFHERKLLFACQVARLTSAQVCHRLTKLGASCTRSTEVTLC